MIAAMPPRVPYDPPDSPTRLEQVSKKLFGLLRGFAYTDPDGERHDVTREGVGETDLASVPRIMWWFVASYGRHTRAALVHDQLVDQIERHDADWVFRCALVDSNVGFVRRWLVFAAVSFETTFRTTRRGVDHVKTAKLVHLRELKRAQGTIGTSQRRVKKTQVRLQRPGPAITVIGFLLVGIHFGVSVWSTWRAIDGVGEWAPAVLVSLSWILLWGEWRALGWAGLGRLAAFAVGVVLVVPFSALLLLPVLLTLVVEHGVYRIALGLWHVRGKKGTKPEPPDFEVKRKPQSGPELKPL